MTFLVEQQFKVVPTPDILALIPAETARGKALDAEGVRLHLFIAADQSKAWQIYRVALQEELAQLLQRFRSMLIQAQSSRSCRRVGGADEATIADRWERTSHSLHAAAQLLGAIR